MNKSRIFGLFALGTSLVLGMAAISTKAGSSLLNFATDTSKSFTIDATNCSPTDNQQYNSVFTGISSDIETFLNLTSGVFTYGNENHIFKDNGGFSNEPTGDFYVGVNNLTAFTFVFSATGLSSGSENYPVIQALLYEETFSNSLGIENLGTPTTIDIIGQSGIEQVVSGTGYQTLRFHFDDWYASASFELISVTVKWSC